MDDALLTTLNDGVMTLTINRPERLNALDVPLFGRLRDACAAAAVNSDVRVLILRGAGKAFSAGGDLVTPPDDLPFDQRCDGLRGRAVIALLLHRMPKPTIAMLRGAVAGAAISFALGCDIRIASETTKFVPAFARAGFSGDYGVSYMLPLIVGQAKARELLFFGDAIDIKTAEAMGMVNRVVADHELEATVEALAARLAAGPTLAYRYMKQNLGLAETATFEQVLDVESQNMVRSILSDDGKEAVQAFREKRPPNFRGR